MKKTMFLFKSLHKEEDFYLFIDEKLKFEGKREDILTPELEKQYILIEMDLTGLNLNKLNTSLDELLIEINEEIQFQNKPELFKKVYSQLPSRQVIIKEMFSLSEEDMEELTLEDDGEMFFTDKYTKMVFIGYSNGWFGADIYAVKENGEQGEELDSFIISPNDF